MTGSPRAHHRVTGSLFVDLPPRQAFRLFTARGEQDWAAGWKPHFPTLVPDDTTPGTVFETNAHGCSTTWIVVDSNPGQSIRYVRVIPGANAGIITVSLQDSAGRSKVTVTYELTSLTQAVDRHVNAFANSYATFLESWQRAIASHLAQQDHPVDS